MQVIEMQGTLREDGTVVLDEKPSMPPGRVKVMMRVVSEMEPTPIEAFFTQLEADRTVHGITTRSREEIDAQLATLRDDEERCQIIERIQSECQSLPKARQGEQ